MHSREAASAYKQASLETAPPLKIVHMLYEGALRFLAQAEQAERNGPAVEFVDRLRRADAIVCELRFCLDHEAAPDVAANLTSLYLFVESRIQEAMNERDIEPIAKAREVLTTLYQGWKAVEVPGNGRMGA